ncbi:MAG: GNAT family N-acetyltransferase [Flavobacteriaceae bacterium]|nr:GNAT family N-acetyltransferase [Flavobacteriaceae bacterium]
MKVVVKTFNELTINELYQILKLRSEIFIVEQDCVYQDIDNKDQKALHLFLLDNEKIVSYARLFNAGNYFKQASIGRVVVQEKYRNLRLGHLLIEESIIAIKKHFLTSKITMSAQKHLKKFYESHQFLQIGEEYLEDGIPHIKMVLS